MQISSKNRRIIVLSDVHQEIDKLNKILASNHFDRVCILGDFFDSRTKDSDEDFIKTCDFVESKLGDSKFRFLLGNHDQHYLYNNQFTICSGYSQNNLKIFNHKFSKHRLFLEKRLEWFFRIDDFLCTHSGLHSSFIPPMIKDLDMGLNLFLKKEGEEASIKIKTNQVHWMYGVGRARRGWANFGGINWLDFNVEYEKVSGLNQIFGHTNGSRIRECEGDYCIDCNLNQWLEISNGKVEIKKFIDL